MAEAREQHSGVVMGGGIILVLLLLALSSALGYAIARQRAAQNRLEQTLDNLPVLMAYIDTEQRFRFNNRAYLEAYGIAPDRLYGRHVREVIGSEIYAQLQPHLLQALAGQSGEFEVHASAGAPGPAHLALTLVPDITSSGQVRGVFFQAADITQSALSEQSERNHQQALARVSRLASIGEITTEIAHQLNQPLAAISMFSHAAQRALGQGGEPAQLHDWLSTINAQAKRASEVIHKLRRFACSDDSESTAMDLNDSVRQVVGLLEPRARARQVALQLELIEPLPPVLASSILVEQVIYNLLSHAIRISEGQGGEGQVGIASRVAEDRVWLDVTSHAPAGAASAGIHPGEVDGHQDAARHADNLAISRDIIGNYGGDLLYRQADSAGASQVSFSLPILQT
jgi:two-component system, LuxR family, sensor histidine kinase DctS